jgi:hypothetical protein
MNPLADNPQVYFLLLCLFVTLTALCLTAVGLFFWRARPVKKDDLQRHKIQERLTELSGTAELQPRKAG